ncbi:ATP-binding protein [Brevibacillus brevis]|uniref:ATP-binding protein n=1 Tax=Brevibacillus brevis TaxID=1393 RepID=UPI0025A66B12|nr:ATP-binding protein [Brevibacillus brevis]WJQ81920.1 ATP-binding protein [Brevibacillus brevis]
MGTAKFKVQPRVVHLLSNQYRSSEQALKELVDNAWDADAEHVHITIPMNLFSTEAIVVQDDGIGMSASQVMSDYLNIAYNRRIKKGELTQYKKRKVRGHKGIGKFAGLVAASQMEVQTTHNKITSTLVINKDDLYNYDNALEELNIEVFSKALNYPSGTKIILSGLNQELNLPSVEKLRELLIFEFGRQSDFHIYINKEKVTFEDIQGSRKTFTKKLDEAGDIAVSLVISDHKKSLKNPGLIIRVGGRAIGEPTFFGLENETLVPKKFLNRIYGEIEADGLMEAVNSRWDYIYENSKGYVELTSFMKRFLLDELKSKFKDETIELENEILHEFKQQIEKFPMPRQEAIRKSINRILQKFYGDSEDKIKTIVSLLIKHLKKTTTGTS